MDKARDLRWCSLNGRETRGTAAARMSYGTGQQSFTTGAKQMADENKNPGFGDFGKMPSFDFTNLMKDFKLPGVDLATIMEREKKNIEALTEANRVAFVGWQALVHRQAEILQESIKRAVGAAQGEDAGTRRMDLASHAFETALSNMRELAEMAAKSQKEAFDVIRKRVEDNLAGLLPPGTDK
jgi:phasin family protein